MLGDVLGASPRFVRPPWGGLLNPHFNLSTILGPSYAMALWDRDTEDWRGNATHILAAYASFFAGVSAADPSMLVLNHDNTACMTEVIPQVLAMGAAAGMRFVTMGECIGIPDPQDWYRFVQNPPGHAPLQSYDATTRNWTFPPRREEVDGVDSLCTQLAKQRAVVVSAGDGDGDGGNDEGVDAAGGGGAKKL